MPWALERSLIMVSEILSQNLGSAISPGQVIKYCWPQFPHLSEMVEINDSLNSFQHDVQR